MVKVRRIRVLALGTFVDNLFTSKVQPLINLEEGLELNWLVDSPGCKGAQSKFTYPKLDGVRYEIVPGWLQKWSGRNLGKLLWVMIRSFRPGYDVYFSYYIWPHGLMLFLLNLLHLGRLKCVHFLISGNDELKASYYSPSGIRHLRSCASLVERCLLGVLKTFSQIAVKGTVSEKYLNQNGLFQTIAFPGSIDIKRFSPQESARPIDLITVARIDVRKNQETLIRAVPALLKQFPSLQVLLVGKDALTTGSNGFSPMHGTMHELVRELKLEDHVKFLEFTTNVEEMYRKSKVYVQTSLSEGLSTSLREAMACGIPAIATDVGDTRDVVGEEKGGLLLSDPMSQSELISAVAQLLRDRELRESVGIRARQLIEQKHSIEYERRLFGELFSRLGLYGDVKNSLPSQNLAPEDNPSRKPRILFLIHKFIQGGAEQQLYELVKGMDKQRYEIRVGCFVEGGEKWDDFMGLSGVQTICFQRKSRFDFLVLKRIIAFLKSNPVDILHAYLPPATIFGIVAGLIARTPILVMGERGTKTGFSKVGPRIYFFLENILSRHVDLIIANSSAGKNWKAKLGVSPNRVMVVHNGLNPARLTPKKERTKSELGVPANSLILGNVARLAPMKDHHTLLKAISLLRSDYPELIGLLVGDGPERGRLEQEVKRLGLEANLIFLGHQECVADFIRLFDVAVLSSKYREGCSNFIMEAMYCGKPVVTTDVGGSAELVVNGVTGWVVEKENPKALASAIKKLLRDSQLRQQMGVSGRRRIEKEFMIEQMVRRTEQIYEELLLRKSTGSAYRPACPPGDASIFCEEDKACLHEHQRSFRKNLDATGTR
jgi:glycosyltransferase involved in cell wall biosynthesis